MSTETIETENIGFGQSAEEIQSPSIVFDSWGIDESSADTRTDNSAIEEIVALEILNNSVPVIPEPVVGEIVIRDEEHSFVDVMEDEGITDRLQAETLREMMTGATKALSTKDEGVIYVPDWTNRFNALKLSMKLKGHLDEKKAKADDLDNKIFVFMKSPR